MYCSPRIYLKRIEAEKKEEVLGVEWMVLLMQRILVPRARSC